MRNYRFFLSAIALTAIMSIITAAPMIETLEQSANSRALNANNLLKRQLDSPACSSICGAPDVGDCGSVYKGDTIPTQICDTITFSGPAGDNCQVFFSAPSDGTCTSLEDFEAMFAAVGNCLNGSPTSGGCVQALNGARMCISTKTLPCQ